MENGAFENTNASNGTMVPYRWNGMLLTGVPASFTGTITPNPNGVGATLSVASLTGAVYPGYSLNYSGCTSCAHIAGSLPLSAQNISTGTYQLDTAFSSSVGPVAMTLTNPTYATYGGADGSSGGTYNAFPNRPIDIADAVGYATYPYGALAGQGSASWGGNGTDNPSGCSIGSNPPASYWASLLSASANYAAGGSTNITNALNAWSADFRNGTINGCAGDNTLSAFLSSSIPGPSYFFNQEAALYDGARPSGKTNLGVAQYESNMQVTLAANNINGTCPSNYTDLAAQFTSNGWNLSAYGSSNSVVAQNVVNLFLAYVNSSQYYNDMLYFWQTEQAQNSTRPFFYPAQFGIEGPGAGCAPLWGLYPGDLTTTPLQNYDAFEYFNNHP
ncbi:unnamed protein product [Sphagnum balticum]